MKRLILFTLIIMFSAGAFAEDLDTGMPVLPDSSTQSVLLRYKFSAGQKINQHTTVVVNVKLDIGGGNQPMTVYMKMDMAGSYTIEKISSDGGMAVRFVFSRVVVDASSIIGMKFDSDDKEDVHPEFSKLRHLLNVPVSMKINALGKTLAVDFSHVQTAMEKAGEEATSEEIRVQIENFTKNAFMLLPEKAVQTGDTYDAGALDQDIPGLGTLQTQSRYRVAALSRDKKKIVLEPLITITMKGTDMSRSNCKGWLLFDTEKGMVEKSYFLTHLDISFVEGESASRLVTDTEILQKIK